MDDIDKVAGTGLLVAAIRARENDRADALFRDPYAQRLAGTAGRRMLDAALESAGEPATLQIVVRTRFFDEAVRSATATARQVVVCAAGMDARAYRLDWPPGTSVFELDQPAVLAAKAAALADETPRCRRVAVETDLTSRRWPDELRDAGFDAQAPSVWLVEGLLQYLRPESVAQLFDHITALAAPGSTLLYDAVGQVLLESPAMTALVESMAAQGAPWLFSTDDPGALAADRGWSATVTDIAEVGNRWERWFAPAVPMEVPGVPRGYFVEAHR